MNDLITKGQALYAYEISGQYDQDDMADVPLDGVWCSIYDILKLAHFGIVDPLDEEDFKEAYDYLKHPLFEPKGIKEILDTDLLALEYNTYCGFCAKLSIAVWLHALFRDEK